MALLQIGVVHMACLAHEWSRTDLAIRSMGYERVLFREMPDTRISDTPTEALVPGTIIEIVEASEFYVDLLERLRVATRGWDGSQPIRDLKRLFE